MLFNRLMEMKLKQFVCSDNKSLLILIECEDWKYPPIIVGVTLK